MESSAETRTGLIRTKSPEGISGGQAEASSSAAAQSPKSTRFRGNTTGTTERPTISDEAEPRTSFSVIRRKITQMSTPAKKVGDAPSVPQQIKAIILASCKSCSGPKRYERLTILKG